MLLCFKSSWTETNIASAFNNCVAIVCRSQWQETVNSDCHSDVWRLPWCLSIFGSAQLQSGRPFGDDSGFPCRHPPAIQCLVYDFYIIKQNIWSKRNQPIYWFFTWILAGCGSNVLGRCLVLCKTKHLNSKRLSRLSLHMNFQIWDKI